MKRLVLILGNQLFAPASIKQNLAGGEDAIIFMREDRELCVHFRYHKQKLVFFLAAMRNYADELTKAGLEVHYEKLAESPHPTFEASLSSFITKNRMKKISHFEIEDKFFERRILDWAAAQKMERETWTSPMFLTERAQFTEYLARVKKPFMKNFYEEQRKRLRVLVNPKMDPVGGQWSFDEENRKPLPKNYQAPTLPQLRPTPEVASVNKKVVALIDTQFPDHPGSAEHCWLPTDRVGAHQWLEQFLRERFHDFGTYEDALSRTDPFLNHSILTPFLNVGLLTPREVIDKALAYAKKHDVPMNSCEGFIRQVIGWREFIRGIYQNFSEKQDAANFWKHQKKLTKHWYDASTGIAPLDDVIAKTVRYGYAHHIERLMIVGSLMLLLGVEPSEAHRWFMEMFIDSSDWVMGPNVYGMALFSDGGIFATKPYICGSNYYRKMGGYAGGDWQDGVDGLYWSFVGKHRAFFLKNHRMAMAVRTFEKMAPEKTTRLEAAAAGLRARLTQ